MSDDFKGRGGSPWGAPPGGGSGGNGSGRGPTPPNVDEIIREFQDKIKKFLPGGKSSGGKSIGLILLVLAFVWLASGLYRIIITRNIKCPRRFEPQGRGIFHARFFLSGICGYGNRNCFSAFILR